MSSNPSIALLTKSYAGDFDLCRDLCISVDRLMPELSHFLVIDRQDLELFAPLATARRTILETECYLPELRPITALGRRLWLSPYGPPMRGWIYQQVAKLAVAATLPQNAVVLVDSDVQFLRPLDLERHFRDGRVRLYRAPGAAQGAQHQSWHRCAAGLLGLERRNYFGADYITNCVTWSPEVVRALLARIRSVTRLPWRMALSWRPRFSEYILYGIFAEHAEGQHRDMLFFDEKDICHCSWHHDLNEPLGREAFISSMAPDQSAVLVQSNLGLDHGTRSAIITEVAHRIGSHSGSQ